MKQCDLCGAQVKTGVHYISEEIEKVAKVFTLMSKYVVTSAEAGFPASRLTREEAASVAELARRGRSAYWKARKEEG